MSDEEILAEESRPLTPSEEELQDPEAPQTFEIHAMYCQWEGCHQGFWELEDMVQHLHDSHIDIQAAKRPQCEWTDCPRKGKPQTSKFALLAHLRSHTGEKPFVCPRPGMLTLAFSERLSCSQHALRSSSINRMRQVVYAYRCTAKAHASATS